MPHKKLTDYIQYQKTYYASRKEMFRRKARLRQGCKSLAAHQRRALAWAQVSQRLPMGLKEHLRDVDLWGDLQQTIELAIMMAEGYGSPEAVSRVIQRELYRFLTEAGFKRPRGAIGYTAGLSSISSENRLSNPHEFWREITTILKCRNPSAAHALDEWRRAGGSQAEIPSSIINILREEL